MDAALRGGDADVPIAGLLALDQLFLAVAEDQSAVAEEGSKEVAFGVAPILGLVDQDVVPGEAAWVVVAQPGNVAVRVVGATNEHRLGLGQDAVQGGIVDGAIRTLGDVGTESG